MPLIRIVMPFMLGNFEPVLSTSEDCGFVGEESLWI
jgi:hypothetical protein